MLRAAVDPKRTNLARRMVFGVHLKMRRDESRRGRHERGSAFWAVSSATYRLRGKLGSPPKTPGRSHGGRQECLAPR